MPAPCPLTAHAARVAALRALVVGLGDVAPAEGTVERAVDEAVAATAHLPLLPLTSAAATAVSLAVEIGFCGGAPLDDPTVPPSPTERALTAALFPAPLVAACRGVGLVRLAAVTSVRDGAAALRAVTGFLAAGPASDPDACLPVLALAARARAPDLVDAARRTAVTSFGRAVAAAPDALAALPPSTLLSILEDDALAATELEAFSAAAAWVAAAPAARARVLPHLVSRGVRLATLPPGALAALDAHPAVRACAATTRAVATAYVTLMTGAGEGAKLHEGRRAAAVAAAAGPSLSPSPATTEATTATAAATPPGTATAATRTTASPRPSATAPPPTGAGRPPTAVSAVAAAAADATPPRRRRVEPGSVRPLAKRLCLE